MGKKRDQDTGKQSVMAEKRENRAKWQWAIKCDRERRTREEDRALLGHQLESDRSEPIRAGQKRRQVTGGQ